MAGFLEVLHFFYLEAAMLGRTAIILTSIFIGSLLAMPVGLLGQNKGKDKDDNKDKDEIRLRAQVKALQNEIDERNRLLKAKDKALDNAMDRARDAEKDARKLNDTIGDLRADLKKLQKQTGDSDKLAQQVKDLTAELQRLRAAQDGEIQNPPVGKIAATIKKVDSAKGIYTLSAGSEAGLKAGHTLEVYRTKPELARLGLLQITDVQSGQATARLRFRPKGAPSIETGDLVADEVRADK
jgi:hypothetical protein